MEQMTLFDMTPPYKYVIDSSSILSQKENELHRRILYKKKWEKIDDLIRKKEIVTCSEVEGEILDENLIKWMKAQELTVIKIDEKIQEKVKIILDKYPGLVDFKQMKSSADAFLIATAMAYKLTVITEENKKKKDKIPYICRALNVPCINILELCQLKGWEF